MKSIKIQNLRSLGDTGYIDIAPITVLLGANNSGKSTFLKSFLMLKQTLEQRVSGPMLFFGDDVDLGDFKTAVTKQLDNGEFIGFGFKLDIPESSFSSRRFRHEIPDDPCFESMIDIKLKQNVKSNDATSQVSQYVSNIHCKFRDNCVDLQIESDGKISSAIVNESNITDLMHALIARDYGRIFPNITDKRNLEERGQEISDRALMIENDFDLILPRTLIEQILKNIDHLANQKIDPDKLSNMLNSIKLTDPLEGAKTLTEAIQEYRGSNSSLPFMKEGEGDTVIGNIWNLIAFGYFLTIQSQFTNYFEIFTRKLSFIAPVRASADRYYRIQNLAVDRVDASGDNLAVYLANLSDSEMSQLKQWLLDNFDLSITIKKGQDISHLQILIGESVNGQQFNIADTGFGYSQVMPILVQLWSLVDRKVRILHHYHFGSIPTFFLVEQPELHLHPELQARLAKIFAKATKISQDQKAPIRMIIETHSEAVINQLGYEIRTGRFSAKDVNIVIFDKDVQTGTTKLAISTFDEEGQLDNWPWGFFDPILE